MAYVGGSEEGYGAYASFNRLGFWWEGWKGTDGTALLAEH
jgi:hypothetical protein